MYCFSSACFFCFFGAATWGVTPAYILQNYTTVYVYCLRSEQLLLISISDLNSPPSFCSTESCLLKLPHFYSCSLSFYILSIWTKGNTLLCQTFINPLLAVAFLQKHQDTAQACKERESWISASNISSSSGKLSQF